jgi:hypothetical protein
MSIKSLVVVVGVNNSNFIDSEAVVNEYNRGYMQMLWEWTPWRIHLIRGLSSNLQRLHMTPIPGAIEENFTGDIAAVHLQQIQQHQNEGLGEDERPNEYEDEQQHRNQEISTSCWLPIGGGCSTAIDWPETPL